MKWTLWTGMVVGILTGSTANAQHVQLGAGYGWMVPTRDLSSFYETGWQLLGAVEVTLPHTPLALRADLMAGEVPSKDPFGGFGMGVGVVTTNLVAYIGSPVTPLRAYVLAGVGFTPTERTYDGAFTVGSGLSVGPRRWKAFAEARYVDAGQDGTAGVLLRFVTISGGLSVGLLDL